MEYVLTDNVKDYVSLARRVVAEGSEVAPRGQATRELVGVTLEFMLPTRPMLPLGVGRKVNAKLAAVEALGLQGGIVSPELILKAAPEYGRVLENPDLTSGAYGPRTGAAVSHCVTLLKADPTTRRAVVTIWRTEDLYFNGDRPCTISLQFLIRDNRLQLHSMMRSQDVFLGIPYDLFCFTQLQQMVARALGLNVGLFRHTVTSLHVYERDFDAIKQMASSSKNGATTELPFGVIVPMQLTPPITRLQAIAQALLAGTADSTVQEYNPWYVSQLQKMGMYGGK